MSSVPVQQAPTGEPILLVGRMWYHHATTTRMPEDTTATLENDRRISEDEATAPADKDTNAVTGMESDVQMRTRVPTTQQHQHRTGVQHYFHPVLHRSPQNVPHNQGRILINLDVVMKGRRTTISHQTTTQHPAMDRTQCQGATCAPSPPRDATRSTMMTTTTTTIPETKDHTASTTRTPKPSGIEPLEEKYHSKQDCDPEKCAKATCGCGISPSPPSSTTQHQSGH